MFPEANLELELQDKTFDKSCCASESVRVSRAFVGPSRVFWPDMGGGKVMTSDSLTKVWLEESCRVGSPGDHGQSRGCKHKIAVTLLRIKHPVPDQQKDKCKDKYKYKFKDKIAVTLLRIKHSSPAQQKDKYIDKCKHEIAVTLLWIKHS